MFARDSATHDQSLCFRLQKAIGVQVNGAETSCE